MKCKTHTVLDHIKDSEVATKLKNESDLDYFGSNANIEADKEASISMHKEFFLNLVMLLQQLGVLRVPPS